MDQIIQMHLSDIVSATQRKLARAEIRSGPFSVIKFRKVLLPYTTPQPRTRRIPDILFPVIPPPAHRPCTTTACVW